MVKPVKPTTLYVWEEVRAALYEAAAREQEGRRITPNELLIALLWQNYPDIAEKHGLPEPEENDLDAPAAA